MRFLIMITLLHWKQSILVMNRSHSPRNSSPVVRAIGHCGTGRNEISRFWPRYRLLMQLVGTTGLTSAFEDYWARLACALRISVFQSTLTTKRFGLAT